MGDGHGRGDAGGLPRVPQDVQPDQTITATLEAKTLQKKYKIL